MSKISLIVAFDENRGIGHENKIPWFIPGELKWVGETTRATTDPEKINALIMGHNTWLSLPVDKRPWPGRLSVVISRNAEIDSPMVKVCRSFDEASAYVKNNNRIETAFVFGGTRVYRQAVDADVLDEALLTIVPGQYDADTYFPEMPESMHCTERHTVKYGNTEVLRETWKKADA